MLVKTTVELNIDEKVLTEATAILDKAGLSLAGALRLTLEEIVRARYFHLAPPTSDEALFELELEGSRLSDDIYGAASLEDLLATFKDGPDKK